MADRASEVKRARKYLDLLKDFEDKGTWVKDFLSSIGSDINESLPPMKMVRAGKKFNETTGLRSMFKSKEENKNQAIEGAEEFANALGELGTFIPLEGAVKASSTGTKNIAELIGAKKLGNAKALIEKAGGTALKIAKDGIATWKDALGNKQTANLTERFGPRNLGISDRHLGINPRAEDADELLSLADQHKAKREGNFLTTRAGKDDIVSRVSAKSGVSRDEMRARAIENKNYEKDLDEVDDELPSFGSKRVNQPKMSSSKYDAEDLPVFTGSLRKSKVGNFNLEHNPHSGTFSLRGPNGEKVAGKITGDEIEMTSIYKGKELDSRSSINALKELGRNERKPIYFTSNELSVSGGDFRQRMLDRGDLVKTDRGLKLYDKAMERQELHGGLGLAGIPKGKAGKVIASHQLPTITTSRFANALIDKLGKRTIKFASDFDKVAYNLALKGTPNKKILANVMKQLEKDHPNITTDTLLQHGERIKRRVDQLGATGKGTIKLPPRSLQILEEAKNPSLRRQILGLPSEYLFAGDLPTLRQHLRPVLTHPIKTGIPSLKRAFSGMTEKGYRRQLETMPDEIGLFDLLDTMDAIGPKAAKEKFPFGEQFRKLTASNTYDYFGTGNLGEKAWGLGQLPKVSRRMFDLATRSVRGTEADRMAELLGTTVQDLAKKGHSELPAMNRSILEHSGHGPLGAAERMGEALSTAFTSPRNTMANMQTWNPLNYLPESALPEWLAPESKGLVGGFGGRYGTNLKSPIYRDNLKDTAKMLGGYGAIKGIDRYLSHKEGDPVDLNPFTFNEGEHVSYNPLDTNFGVNLGGYRPDIFGSAKGVATLLPRLLQPLLRTGARALDDSFDTNLEPTFTGVNAKGEDENLRPMDELNKFARYRLRPGPISILGDLTLGYNDDKGEPGDDIGKFTNAIGEDISKPYDEDSPIMSTPLKPLAELPGSREIGNQFTTSWPANVYDAFKEAGIPQGILATVLGGLGSGSATYDPFDKVQGYRPPYKNIRVPVKGKEDEEALPGGIH